MFIKIENAPERLYFEEPVDDDSSESSKKIEYIDVYAIKTYKQYNIDNLKESFLEVWYLNSNQISNSKDVIRPYTKSKDFYKSGEFCKLISDYLRNKHELIFSYDLNWTERGLQSFTEPGSKNRKWPLDEDQTELFLENGHYFLEKAHLIAGLWGC